MRSRGGPFPTHLEETARGRGMQRQCVPMQRQCARPSAGRVELDADGRVLIRANRIVCACRVRWGVCAVCACDLPVDNL